MIKDFKKLIEDKNGEIYNGSFRDLYTKVDILLNNKEKCKVLGMNAYNTITKETGREENDLYGNV